MFASSRTCVRRMVHVQAVRTPTASSRSVFFRQLIVFIPETLSIALTALSALLSLVFVLTLVMHARSLITAILPSHCVLVPVLIRMP